MNFFLRFILGTSLLFSISYGGKYENIDKISLKKDEQKKILVKYANSARLFKFRWTLYVNDALVVFHSYDGIQKQNVLYLNNQNNSFIVELTSRGADFYNVARLLVKFKEFDVKQNRAVFELFLDDRKSEIGIENLKNG